MQEIVPMTDAELQEREVKGHSYIASRNVKLHAREIAWQLSVQNGK
jgi:hypothetical protein